MSRNPQRSQRKHRRLQTGVLEVPVPVQLSSAPSSSAGHVYETWRASTGEELQCKLYAATDDSVSCGIMHEPAREVEVDDLPRGWPAGACEANCAQLECGHVFHPAALALHFLVTDMRCPVCRAGPVGRMQLESVPQDMRAAYAAKLERVATTSPSAEDIQQLRCDILTVLTQLEVGLLVLGPDNDNGLTRASARTRIVFEASHVDEIQRQVLQAADARGTHGGADGGTNNNTLSRDSASTFGMHRSFQRLARAVVGRQLEHNAAGRVRFTLVHPLVPVPMSSREIGVAEAWHEFFNAPAGEVGEAANASEPRAAQPQPIPLFCVAVAGTHPVGLLRAHFAGAAAAPELTVELNTLMLVNIAAYVRQVLESIRHAVEQHTAFDAHTEVEITAQYAGGAVNGLQFML